MRGCKGNLWAISRELGGVFASAANAERGGARQGINRHSLLRNAYGRFVISAMKRYEHLT
jgi:hypothetical protein